MPCSLLVVSCASKPEMSGSFRKDDTEQKMRELNIDPTKTNWIEWAIKQIDPFNWFGDVLREAIAMPEFLGGNLALNNIVVSIVKIH